MDAACARVPVRGQSRLARCRRPRPLRASLPALRDPAWQGGRLPNPPHHLRLVELVVLVDVEVTRILVLGLAERNRTQQCATEESHLDVLREAMEAKEPALGLDTI